MHMYGKKRNSITISFHFDDYFDSCCRRTLSLNVSNICNNMHIVTLSNTQWNPEQCTTFTKNIKYVKYFFLHFCLGFLYKFEIWSNYIASKELLDLYLYLRRVVNMLRKWTLVWILYNFSLDITFYFVLKRLVCASFSLLKYSFSSVVHKLICISGQKKML